MEPVVVGDVSVSGLYGLISQQCCFSNGVSLSQKEVDMFPKVAREQLSGTAVRTMRLSFGNGVELRTCPKPWPQGLCALAITLPQGPCRQMCSPNENTKIALVGFSASASAHIE